MRTPYWDWTFRDGELHYHKYCGTPPEHLLFALRAALDMMFAEGLDNVFRRHRLLAEATRRAVGVWARRAGDRLQRRRSRSERSDTVTTVVTHGRRRARSRWSITAATSAAWCSAVRSARSEGKGFRIAHMGHVNAPMMLGTLGVVEIGPRRRSACRTARAASQAAVEYLAQAVPA